MEAIMNIINIIAEMTGSSFDINAWIGSLLEQVTLFLEQYRIMEIIGELAGIFG